MFALNDNNGSKQCQRYMDLDDEPLVMMTPIRGYGKMPLVSLEEAVKPLVKRIPEIEHMAYVAKTRCKKPPPDGLSIDQSAAIMLYTLEWVPKEGSVYRILNKDLRTEDRQALKPWFLYLKLLVTALSLLPSTSCTVYRGIKNDPKSRYKKGENIVWWGFSSCTSTMDVLSNEAFLGPSGKRTLFAIECQNGKDIRQHSYFKAEDEILLPAAREFKVKSILPQGDGLNIIQLQEVEPQFPLLELFPTISKLVQSFPQSNSNPVIHKTSAQPVSKQPSQTLQNQPYYVQPQQDNTNLNEAIPRPLEIEGHCFGSDPITHKKTREEQTNETSGNRSTAQSTSTASSSTSTNTQTKTTDTSEQHSESSIKREK